MEADGKNFHRPYGTKSEYLASCPSDESLGYFQATLRVEIVADT